MRNKIIKILFNTYLSNFHFFMRYMETIEQQPLFFKLPPLENTRKS